MLTFGLGYNSSLTIKPSYQASMLLYSMNWKRGCFSIPEYLQKYKIHFCKPENVPLNSSAMTPNQFHAYIIAHVLYYRLYFNVYSIEWIC